jgi:endoplasmic reticulum protein 29
MQLLSLSSLLLSLLWPTVTLAINCKGCTPLDKHTFDKVVNAFPVSIVKFDVAYPYGDKHDEFAKIALEAADLTNVFVGEVGIKDYGDKVQLQ